MEFVVPEKFKERYASLVDDSDAFVASLATYPPKTFRVNTLKTNIQDVVERFAGYGLPIRQVSWYKDAFLSENPDIGATLEHFLGHIYLQELVSMLPPYLVMDELKKAKFVLDGCAAPGSKTTQMAALMENKGTIIANDLAYARIRALKFNLEKTGTLNTIITNRDLRTFPNIFFDVVLIDAPCSAEGTIRKNFEVFDSWNERSIATYSKVQKVLILKSFDLLAPGGSMVYSTCTFAPEENESVVDFLLKNRQDAKLEPITIEGFKLSKPVEEWNGVRFDPEVAKAARVWPHHNDTGGFFLAKVSK